MRECEYHPHDADGAAFWLVTSGRIGPNPCTVNLPKRDGKAFRIYRSRVELDPDLDADFAATGQGVSAALTEAINRVNQQTGLDLRWETSIRNDV